ncbi:glycosyltransferase [bacterium]|jgi:GT2 family glycosyltransferase|nr:glycosyltransferase [bacterium]
MSETFRERCTLSFVVITANRALELADCLQSIRRQQVNGAEIIVVDNASTDSTATLLSEQFPEVKVHYSPTNLGVSEGRNVGISLAQGEICVCIDDDAFFSDDDAASTIISSFDENPMLACLAMTILNATTGEEETKGIPRRDKKVVEHDYEATYFCGAGFAVRRSLFLQAGQFWAPLVYGSQEIDLGYRFLEAGWSIKKSASIRVHHRSTMLARPSGQWVYFNTRDRPWVAIRHLPWPAVLTTTLLWWGNTFRVALSSGQLSSFFRGFVDSLAGFPRAWQGRKVISRTVIELLANHSGRYWY